MYQISLGKNVNHSFFLFKFFSGIDLNFLGFGDSTAANPTIFHKVWVELPEEKMKTQGQFNTRPLNQNKLILPSVIHAWKVWNNSHSHLIMNCYNRSIGKRSQLSFYSGNNNNNNETNSSYSTNTSLTRKQQRKSIESTYGKDYTVSQIRQVGYLSGKDIIRDMSQVRMDDFQHYYDEADRAQSELEFEPHHLDSQQVQPAQFVDPFTADMFRDEMVDIDFGAIDAFTEALNQQILAEKNGVEPPKNLQFPPHVIASNHASFLENQLFLADTNTEDNSGVNVQFITPSLKNKPAPGSHSTNLNNKIRNANESMLEKLARAEYSRNQSFGSVIDVQKPNGKNVNNTSYNSFMQNLSRNMSHQSLVRWMALRNWTFFCRGQAVYYKC